MTDRKGPAHVGDLVEAFLEKKGVRSQVRRMEVLERWSERVGEGIGRVTRPRSISDGTLFVEVRSSPWLMELDMMKDDVLSRVNEGQPHDAQIRRIVFVLAEDG